MKPLHCVCKYLIYEKPCAEYCGREKENHVFLLWRCSNTVEKLKDFYNEYSCTQYLDSTVIHCYLLNHISIPQSIHRSAFLIFLDVFQSKLLVHHYHYDPFVATKGERSLVSFPLTVPSVLWDYCPTLYDLI